jgi:hypothetical protein
VGPAFGLATSTGRTTITGRLFSRH